jgi:hypothetical protein
LILPPAISISEAHHQKLLLLLLLTLLMGELNQAHYSIQVFHLGSRQGSCKYGKLSQCRRHRRSCR